MENKLIAPCGMNCGVCERYLRIENKCPGCRNGRLVNQKRIQCAIQQCKQRRGEYCFDCESFACDRLKRMDARYRAKYAMSEIHNLEMIREKGIAYFLEQEGKRWVNADGVLCVHDGKRYP